jgi:hypothetical protein
LKGYSLQPEELKDEDRTLVVVGLQARQRTSAYNSTLTACSLAGKTVPSVDIFGLHAAGEKKRQGDILSPPLNRIA